MQAASATQGNNSENSLIELKKVVLLFLAFSKVGKQGKVDISSLFDIKELIYLRLRLQDTNVFNMKKEVLEFAVNDHVG